MRHLLFAIFLIPLSLFGQQVDNSLLFNKVPERIKVDNRILAEINGKPITVLDLQKKMDFIMKQEFPQYMDNPIARYQFYQASWRQIFDEMVDRELILADTKRMQMQLTNGEVRQEMISTFGPDVMNTLDQLNLSYAEASEAVKEDILVRRMTFARAHMKAFTKVHPSNVRDAYQAYLENFDDSEQLTYRVVTVRSDDENHGSEIAESINRQLEGGTDLETVVSIVMQQIDADPTTSVKLSERFVQKSSLISSNYLETLNGLSSGTVSTPIAQHSRASGKTVYRLFLLEDRVTDPAQPFEELEELLNNRLIQESIAEETSKYTLELRDQFNMTNERIEELIPQDFSPFSLN